MRPAAARASAARRSVALNTIQWTEISGYGQGEQRRAAADLDIVAVGAKAKDRFRCERELEHGTALNR